MDALADLGVSRRASVLSGRRIRQRGVVDAAAEAGGRHWTEWVRNGLAAILGPTTAYVVPTLAAVAVLGWAGVGARRFRRLGSRHASVVRAGLPRPADADTRRGGGTPALGAAGAAVLALAVVVVDVAARIRHLPAQVSPLPAVLGSDLSGWICWRGGDCGSRRPVLIAAAGAIVLAMLLGLRCYPISMVDRPRARAEQLSPYRGVACVRHGASCALGRGAPR